MASPQRSRLPSPRAAHRARQLGERLCLDQAQDIDVELVAWHLGASVQRKALPGEAGRLVRVKGGRRAAIIVREGLAPDRERFVIAHEIGHLELHPELDQFKACSEGDMLAYHGDGREAEANRFAAELLMPRRLFEPRCDVHLPSLDPIRELASDFRTSLTATGIQFVHCCPEPCAFVMSRAGKIVWSARSETFPLYLKPGWLLPHGGAGNFAGGFLRRGEELTSAPGLVDADSWSDSDLARERELHEHSVGWGEGPSRGTLSLLWLKGWEG